MTELPLEQPSGLNLNLHGSAGRFRISSSGLGTKSLQVTYFLTNVGLALGQGTNDALLAALAPVREVFKVEDLGFDELMQRDIDDARVASELVPYLLDAGNADLIKLFPPIVVMLLPVLPGQSGPARLYPPTTTFPATMDAISTQVTRSGSEGQEIFQLQQPLTAGGLNDHDRVRLRLNTHATRLVIVDGQHRAMALLAIHRNLREEQWGHDRRRPYQDYYKEWSPALIGAFNLEDVQLPVMICTVPELDATYTGDYDLVRAARRVFLTLNKTARKVSDSRNRLLDDADLMAVFLREVLGFVKSRGAGTNALKIWNVELDQAADRVRVTSPLALTGVNHVYYVVEHLMLNSHDTHGLRPRSGRFASRTSLESCMSRLDGADLLGDDAAGAMKRDQFKTEDATLLAARFMQSYGNYVVRIFDELQPYSLFNSAVVSLRDRLRNDRDARLEMTLFEGQGFLRIFEEYRQSVRSRLREGVENETHRESLSEVSRDLAALRGRLDEVIAELEQSVVKALVYRALGAGGGTSIALAREVRNLYTTWYTSVAFQAAIAATFFGEIERRERIQGVIQPDVAAEFANYMQQLSAFFAPSSRDGLINLLRVFAGEPQPRDGDDWSLAETTRTFKAVVFRGEMQPDQWPKYRYLLLELWRPLDSGLEGQVVDELELCRTEAVDSLFRHLRAQFARQQGIPEGDLGPDDLEAIAELVVSDWTAFMSALAGRAVSPGQVRNWALGPPTAVDEEAPAEDAEG